MKAPEWYDISPLPLPDEPFNWVLWSTLLFTFVAVIIGIKLWRGSPRQQARQRLLHIQQQYKHGLLSHKVALLIREVIRQRFETNAIEKIIMPEQQAWQDYCQRLRDNSFPGRDVDAQTQQALLKEAFHWIMQPAERS